MAVHSLARFASFADLNHWLATRCQELAQRKHPTERSRSIAECFVQEQAHLRVIDAPFDGYVEQMRSVSSTCLVRVDRNQYSVPAQWAGKVTSVRCTADEIRIVADDQLIARHARRFGRDQLVYDPWHYLAVLDKKPGALRNGAPFVTWDLPEPIKQVREYLLKQSRGDRAFVDLLLLARDVGLEALQVACELALESGVINGSHVMNELRRLTSVARPVELTLPEALQLRIEPLLIASAMSNCEVLSMPTDRISELKNLHLHGMASALQELLAEASRRPARPELWLDRLIEAEQADRQSAPFELSAQSGSLPNPP